MNGKGGRKLRRVIIIEFETAPEHISRTVNRLFESAIESIGEDGLLLSVKSEEPLRMWSDGEEVKIPDFLSKK